jgi:hypothetical protein
MAQDSGAHFESAIRSLTAPINGQFPRSWMTDLQNPLLASVFIVGQNQARDADCDGGVRLDDR